MLALGPTQSIYVADLRNSSAGTLLSAARTRIAPREKAGRAVDLRVTFLCASIMFKRWNESAQDEGECVHHSWFIPTESSNPPTPSNPRTVWT